MSAEFRDACMAAAAIVITTIFILIYMVPDRKTRNRLQFVCVYALCAIDSALIVADVEPGQTLGIADIVARVNASAYYLTLTGTAVATIYSENNYEHDSLLCALCALIPPCLFCATLFFGICYWGYCGGM